MYIILSSANKFILSCSVPISIHVISLPSCSSLTSITILSRHVENALSRLVPDYSGTALNFFLLKLMFAMGLLQSISIVLKYVPWVTNISRNFIIKAVGFCLKT